MSNNHVNNVTYNGYDCNSGISPEPNTYWNPQNSAWEWNDISVSSGSIPGNLPAEIKEALENNICIICGAKNCPYIRTMPAYKKLLDALKTGDKDLASRIYKTNFAQFYGSRKPDLIKGISKSRAAKASDGSCGVRNNSTGSKQAWAPPLTWGPWIDLQTHTGGSNYTVGFDTASEGPSSFDVQVQFTMPNEMKTINTLGPGAYPIRSPGGAGTDRIRFKSHSTGQNIIVNY